jgi:hypothetical protein
MNFSLTQNRGKDFAYINQSPRYPTQVAYDDSISICSIDGTTIISGRGTDGQGLLSESNVGKEASFSVFDADVAKNGVLRPAMQSVFLFSTSKDEDNKQIKSKKRRTKCACSSTAMNYHVDDNNTSSSNAACVSDDSSPPRMILMIPSSTTSTNSTSIDVGGTSDLYPRPTRLEILKRGNIMSTTHKTSTGRDLYSIFESIDKMLILTSQNKQELHDYYKNSATTRRARLRAETKEDSTSSSNQSF